MRFFLVGFLIVAPCGRKNPIRNVFPTDLYPTYCANGRALKVFSTILRVSSYKISRYVMKRSNYGISYRDRPNKLRGYPLAQGNVFI